MDKFKEILKRKVKDETAAFAILTAMIITIFTTIGINEFIRYNRIEQASSHIEIELSQSEQVDQTNTFSTLNEITSKEKLENSEEEKNKKQDNEKSKAENEKEYEKLKNENKISSAADKYYIKVNYGAQVVTVYEKDSNGKYTKPIRAMVCSTGTYTPSSGVYRTLAKRNWWPLYGDVFGQYATHIYDGILFHSVPYLKSGDKSSLEYWAYDQLGQRVSMGCVRLTVEDAKWIYDNCVVGTRVEFYSSSNPGPWGKPTTMKISNAPDDIRGWDPTDPDSENPWPKYLESLEEANETKNEVINEVIDTPENDVVNKVVDNTVNDIVNDMENHQVNDVTNEVEDKPVNNIVNDVMSNEENLQVNNITNNDEDIEKTNNVNNEVNDVTKDETNSELINDVSSEKQNELKDNVYVSELL